MVYLPLALDRAQALRAGEPLDRARAHAATPSLRRALALSAERRRKATLPR